MDEVVFLEIFNNFAVSQKVIRFCFYHSWQHLQFSLFGFVISRQWLPRNKLEPLGVDSGMDRAKLLENKKPNVRKAVRKAYEKAIHHRCKVTGEPNPLTADESGTED